VVTTFPWQVSVHVAGVALDTSIIPVPLEVTHGRSSGGTQPDAPVCSFLFDGPEPPGQEGDEVTVADWGSPRFYGRIVSVEAFEFGGQIVRWQVRAVGGQARLGVTPVLLTRPAESDVARVQAIATAAGVIINVAGTPGVTLAADAIDRSALAALHQVCESSAGLIWQSRDGALWYGAADHREPEPVAVVPAGAILDGVKWRRDLDAIVNHVTVKWGPEGAQTQNTHRDDASITRWGLRHVDITTLCADQVNADQLALMVLARRKNPFWTMPGIVLPMDAMTAVDRESVQSLEVGTGVLLPIGLQPDRTPAPVAAWTVEGWQEQWDESGHTLVLAVTDRARSSAAGLRTWETAALGTWADWAAGSWLDQLVEVA